MGDMGDMGRNTEKPDPIVVARADHKVNEQKIFERAVRGDGATLEQAVKVFSNPDNWRFEHLEKDGKVIGGAWVWQGNWKPPWEFAMHALKSGDAR